MNREESNPDRLELIMFDVGNVVIEADSDITFRILKDQGVPEERARTFFDNEVYREFSRGRASGREFYQSLVRDSLQCSLSYDQIVWAHNEHIYGIDEDVVHLLPELKRKLVFLTDTNVWQTKRERELVDLSSYSDTIFRSHETHMLKTDEGCFPYVINQLGHEPGEVLLIDDSIEKIRKAQENGLQTLQFTNSRQLVESLKRIGLL